MKKSILIGIIFCLFLKFPADSDASYLILLKNGGRLVTPMHWVEGEQIKFYIYGGVAGVGKEEIERIESRRRETNDYIGTTLEDQGEKEPPPLSITEKVQGPEVKEGEVKVNLEDYKNKKDRMTVELDGLMEKRREATARGDNDAKKKISEEIIKVSEQIYKLSDEVTEKNKGKLPEGWWER